MRSDGFISVEDLLASPKYRVFGNQFPGPISVPELKLIVATNAKQRFEMREFMESNVHTLYIRATQGHSLINVKQDQLCDKLTLDAVRNSHIRIFHGTYFSSWQVHGFCDCILLLIQNSRYELNLRNLPKKM